MSACAIMWHMRIKNYSEKEFDTIKKVTKELHITQEDSNRIEQEVRKDLKI